MAENLRPLTASVATKSRLLLQRYRSLLQSKSEADERIARLEDELRACRSDIERLEQQLEYSKAAHALAPTPEARLESRRMIADMLHRIDKCIEQLTY